VEIYERYGAKAMMAVAVPAAGNHRVRKGWQIAYVVYEVGRLRQLASYAARKALSIYPPPDGISLEERCAFIAASIAIELGEQPELADLDSIDEDARAFGEVFHFSDYYDYGGNEEDEEAEA